MSGAVSVSVLFSEPKIPQSQIFEPDEAVRSRFSALQRAENSSIDVMLNRRNEPVFEFQCSSASRKFLNRDPTPGDEFPLPVSVLFSEPKIPQFGWIVSKRVLPQRVSVLFSEPKIPQ